MLQVIVTIHGEQVQHHFKHFPMFYLHRYACTSPCLGPGTSMFGKLDCMQWKELVLGCMSHPPHLLYPWLFRLCQIRLQWVRLDFIPLSFLYPPPLEI